MKLLTTFTLAITMALSLSGQSNITGTWILGEENTQVEFQQNEEGIIDGKIMSSDNPKAKIGKIIVKEVKFKDGEWTGKIYSPKRQKWSDAILGRKQDILEVTVSAGFLSKTLKWKKANN